MQETEETQFQSLDWEDALEEEMATHSRFLPGESHGQGSLAGYSPWGRKETRLSDWHTHKLLFKVAASFNISINSVQGFQFSHICSNTSYCLFDYSCTIGCELVRHSGFICIYIVTESEKVGLKLNIQKTKIMACSPITSWQIDGKQWQTLFSWAPESLQMVTAAMKLKDACPLEEKLWST